MPEQSLHVVYRHWYRRLLPTASLLALAGTLVLAACHSPPRQQTMPVLAEPAVTAGLHRSVNNVQAHDTTAADLSASWQPTWLPIIDTRFKQAKSLVEQQLQVDLSDIGLRLVDDTAINAEVAVETRRLIEHQFGNTAFAGQILDQVMQPLSGTYAALYSPRLRAVMISRPMLRSYEYAAVETDTASAGEAALMTLLIHELVHAADDLRFRISDNRALNFRASFAQSATFEGHAQWVTRNICAKAGCLTGLAALDHFMFGNPAPGRQTNEHTLAAQAISRNVLEYSYVEGERFISDLAARDNGPQLIEQVLSKPPMDPLQILAPDTYPDTDREDRNQQLLDAIRGVRHAWSAEPWIAIETSPLKGIDFRSDPLRRQSAVDGFTRLIQSMVSMQFYNQQAAHALPVEATVLQAESPKTAALFATIMHSNLQQFDSEVSEATLVIDSDVQARPLRSPLQIRLYRTELETQDTYRTIIATAGGKHVVQISGSNVEQPLLDDYAIQVLLNLLPAADV